MSDAKHLVYYVWIALTISFFGAFSYAPADLAQAEIIGEPPLELKAKVILISGKRGCASGYELAPGYVLTNFHVARTACALNSCLHTQFRALSADGRNAWRKLKITEPRVIQTLPSLDLALISLTGEAFDSSNLPQPGTVAQNDHVHVLGFPNCQYLVHTKGTILEQSSAHLLSSAAVARGSSGSPVFNQAHELIGIVSQAGSLGEALLGRSARKSYLTDWRAAHRVLSSSPELSLQTELDILHSYYRSDVLSTAGFERIGASTRFVAMTEGLRARIAMQAGNPDLLRISSAYSVSRVLTHIELGRDPTLMRALSIMLARYLEEYGLRDGITRPLRLSDIVLRIQTSELTVEQQSHLLNILNRFSESEYDGLNPTLIKIGSYLVCVGLFWTFSMGYVFGIARGGYLRRALTTLLVAVALWPLSLVVFMLRSWWRAGQPRGQGVASQ